MSNNQFVGRGEKLFKNIIQRIYPESIVIPQVNIGALIFPSDFNELDQEFRNHNVDFVVRVSESADSQIIIAEINYKHGDKAAKKWSGVFSPLLQKAGYIPLTVDDYDCREKGIFYLNSKDEHIPTWDDWRDVIDALEKAGVTP